MNLKSFSSSITLFLSFALILNGVQSTDELTLAEQLCNKKTDEFCAYYGYTPETHHVTTEDGYILTLFRCTNETAPSNGRAVILMHGILAASDDYVMNIPNQGLSYIMADEGYDVWLPNFRGNVYSRHHVSKDPDDPASGFWNFSWDIVGYRDYPAIFHYIRNVTGVSKLFLVAHSQGTSSLMALLSKYPQYNNYLHAASLLAPISYLYHAAIRYQILGLFEKPLEILAHKEFLPRTPLSNGLGALCALGNESALCNLVADLFLGPSNDKNQTLLPIFICHFPSGASADELLHFAQEIDLDFFGERKTGVETPPDFPLHQITIPLSLYYSKYDVFTNEKDVNRLIAQLNNTRDLKVKKITQQFFDHQDFVWGMSAAKLVYSDVLKFFNKHAES